MAITIDDFSKIWASTSPLTPYEFSENNYKQGWDFVGATPPSRQMWDFLQKNNDEKMKYLADNYLPLSGGTMTGNLNFSSQYTTIASTYTNNKGGIYLQGGSADNKGARIRLLGMNNSQYAGQFQIMAHDGVNGKSLIGKPDGTLLWGSDNVITSAGGTITGPIEYKTSNNLLFNIKPTGTYADVGWSYKDNHGGLISLRNTNYTNNPGGFEIFARNSSGEKILLGKPDGTLIWDGSNILTAANYNSYALPLVPTGVIQAFAGSTTPQGWLLCDGSAVSRTDYAKLYAVIGTTYGKGNGSTTFNLPNLVDKFVEGSATAGTVKSAGLPNITGGFGLRSVDGGQNVTWEGNNGAVKVTTKTGDNSNCVAKGSSQNPLMEVTIDASRSSSVYGNSTTVQPPALTMRYIIKY